MRAGVADDIHTVGVCSTQRRLHEVLWVCYHCYCCCTNPLFIFVVYHLENGLSDCIG